MANDLMDYEAMVRDAYRVIVRKVLARVAKTGLPGDHHFYVTFDTSAPGVDIPDFLRERYPQEMTIVLQNDFWGLEVDDAEFEVHLHFDGRPSRMVVPFNALTGFLDPTVQFGVKFDVDENGLSLDDEPDGEIAPRPATQTDWAQDDDTTDPDDSGKAAGDESGKVISLSNYRKD